MQETIRICIFECSVFGSLSCVNAKFSFRFFLSADFKMKDCHFLNLFRQTKQILIDFFNVWLTTVSKHIFLPLKFHLFGAWNVEKAVILFRCHKYMRRRWKQEYYKLQQRLELSVDQFRPLLHMLGPSWMSVNRRKN